MNLLGSMPVVGIYIGAKRISTVAQYNKMFGSNTGGSQGIIKDLGELQSIGCTILCNRALF